MKMLALRSAAIVALALAAGPAWGQTMPAKTLHRVQVGKLDASGWTDARSSEGNFSARMPCLYDDATVDTRSPGTLMTYALACFRADGSVFSASRMFARGGEEQAARWLARAEDVAARNGVVGTAGRVNGMRSLETSVLANGHCRWVRMILAGESMVRLEVEGQGRRCTALAADAVKFFDSVEIKQR